jgi:hypothetical protein
VRARGCKFSVQGTESYFGGLSQLRQGDRPNSENPCPFPRFAFHKKFPEMFKNVCFTQESVFYAGLF